MSIGMLKNFPCSYSALDTDRLPTKWMVPHPCKGNVNRTWGLSITTTKKEDMRLEGRQGEGMGGLEEGSGR